MPLPFLKPFSGFLFPVFSVPSYSVYKVKFLNIFAYALVYVTFCHWPWASDVCTECKSWDKTDLWDLSSPVASLYALITLGYFQFSRCTMMGLPMVLVHNLFLPITLSARPLTGQHLLISGFSRFFMSSVEPPWPLQTVLLICAAHSTLCISLHGTHHFSVWIGFHLPVPHFLKTGKVFVLYLC